MHLHWAFTSRCAGLCHTVFLDESVHAHVYSSAELVFCVKVALHQRGHTVFVLLRLAYSVARNGP